MTKPLTKRIAVLVSATAAAALVSAVGPLGAPAGAATVSLHTSLKTTVVNGVQRWSIWWNNAHGYQHGYVMSIDLTTPGLSIRPALGHDVLNLRETTLGIAGRAHAVAGINGDLFDWDTALPWGGVGINGVVFKSPPKNRVSQFYITNRGTAGIGALNWTGSITPISSTGRLGTAHPLSAVNSLNNANAGGLTLITPAMVGESLNGCAAVVGTISGRTITVRRTYARMRGFAQLPSTRVMLAACGPTGQWLLRHAPAGQRLRLAQRLTTTSGVPVSSFISGQRALRLNGQRYSDVQGLHTYGINPETAVCVSQDGRHIQFLTVDGWLGWTHGSNGITLGELSDLATAQHCYSTTVLDGGGSTTMVSQSSGTLRVVNQVPSWYGQRPVSNALLVVKN